MNVQTSTPSQRLREAVRPYLPGQAESGGATAARLASGCEQYIDAVEAGQTPGLDPYGPDMSVEQTLDVSQQLKSLAEGTQADFAERVGDPAAQLRLGQLIGATGELETDTRARIEEMGAARQALKSSYNGQVARTVGWMGATAGSLLLGGIFPNPVTVVLVGATTYMTIRSLGKARAAQKELAKKLPPLEMNLRVQRQLLADTVQYAPHLAAWDSLLESGEQASLAA